MLYHIIKSSLLISNDINIDEGISLVTVALNTYPDYWDYLYTYGLGLYKQKEYQKAFDILTEEKKRTGKTVSDIIEKALLHLRIKPDQCSAEADRHRQPDRPGSNPYRSQRSRRSDCFGDW